MDTFTEEQVQKEKKLAYLAGLFDGEGSFSIQVDSRDYKGRPSLRVNPRISMSLKYHNEVLDEFVDTFGGKVYDYPDGTRRWSLGKLKILKEVTNSLLPELKVKRESGLKFLEGLEIIPESKKGINRTQGQRAWTPEMTKKITKIALDINPPQSRKSRKDLSFIEEISKIYEKD